MGKFFKIAKYKNLFQEGSRRAGKIHRGVAKRMTLIDSPSSLLHNEPRTTQIVRRRKLGNPQDMPVYRGISSTQYKFDPQTKVHQATYEQLHRIRDKIYRRQNINQGSKDDMLQQMDDAIGTSLAWLSERKPWKRKGY